MNFSDAFNSWHAAIYSSPEEYEHVSNGSDFNRSRRFKASLYLVIFFVGQPHGDIVFFSIIRLLGISDVVPNSQVPLITLPDASWENV